MYDHTTEMLQAHVYCQAQCGEFGSAATMYTRSRRDGRRGPLLAMGWAFRKCWLQGLARSARSALEPMMARRLAVG